MLTNAEKKKLYDSGQMQFDGDTGFENMGDMGGMGGFSNAGGFSNMNGGNTKTTFKMNGQNMGNVDPSEIFSMFMGKGMGGFGGFGGMGGMGGMGGIPDMGRGSPFGDSTNKNNKWSSSQKPHGFDAFNFGSFGKNMNF